MLMQAIDSYLAVRRTVGYDLTDREGFLRSFARFADERGETHLRAETAIEWARLGSSPPQWDRRIKEIIRFARHVHAEDPRHEIPPQGIVAHPPQHRLRLRRTTGHGRAAGRRRRGTPLGRLRSD